jgi:hypothetical protein
VGGDVSVSHNKYSDQSDYESPLSSSLPISAGGYEADLRIGLGLGRKRYVTPVIRALRLSERLAELGKVNLLAPEQILSVAEHFAKRSGYTEVYQRWDRHFWDDLFETIDHAGSLNPYEAHYVADVLDEKTGKRYEGWSVSSGLEFTSTYYHSGGRDEAILGWFAEAGWYRNLTLTTQLGLEGWADYGVVIAENGGRRDSDGLVRVTPEFLWIVNDRILWESQLEATLIFGKAGRTSSGPRDWFLDKRLNLTSDFTFFVEDNLSLDVGMAYALRIDDEWLSTIRRTDFLIWSLGLTYYLDRRLM